MTRITPRSRWGARHANGARPAPLPALDVFAHHTTGPVVPASASVAHECRVMRDLEDIGEQRFKAGISYTDLIFPSGRIYEGHTIDREGAHTRGHNKTGRAICFVGNYENQKLTSAAEEAAAWLLAHRWLSGHYAAIGFTGGHNTVAATACPGRHVTERLPAINQRAHALVTAVLLGVTDQQLPNQEDHMIPGFATSAWAWAQERGIITRKTDPAEERPNDPVTRAEVVTMLHRLAEGQTETPPGFAVGAYGRLDDLVNRPRPEGLVTEARLITILDRLIKKVTGS